MTTNRELYLKLQEMIGKEELEKKQRSFLVRNIRIAEQKAQNLSASELNKKKALEILADLNNVCMGHFRASDENLRLIYARLAQDFEVDDFKAIHRLKAGQWLDNPDMRKYLRPSTLYCASKFEGYLNEAISAKEPTILPASRKWSDYKTLAELIKNRSGLEIPDNVKQMYALYAVYRDRKEYEKMKELDERYQEVLNTEKQNDSRKER